MASSSSHKKLNDALHELYNPAEGSIDLEILLFHGFQSKDHQNPYVETWMRLSSLLSKTFPQCRILSVSYDSSIVESDSEGRMDIYVVGENLAKSIVELARFGQDYPVMLVGYCVGGLVLKEVCCMADKLTTKVYGEGINPYSSFLRNVKGVFFFISTSQVGSSIQSASKLPRIEATSKRPGPLLEYYELLNSEIGRLHADFSELRERFPYAWKTRGIAIETEDDMAVLPLGNSKSLPIGRKRPSTLLVEEASARIDMDEFCVLPVEDPASICKPKDQNSSSF